MASSPRKFVKAKRLIESTPLASSSLKSVTFNDNVVETSIGGTQRVGKIKKDLLLQFSTPGVTKTKLAEVKVSELVNNDDNISLSSISETDDRMSISSCDTNTKSPFLVPSAGQTRKHTLQGKLSDTPDCFREIQFGTPRATPGGSQDESIDASEDGENSCSVTVAVRVRPFNQRELSDPNARCAISMSGNETTVTLDNGSVFYFAFDWSFWSHDKSSAEFCDQENVYNRLAAPLLGKALEGYNTCLFAYGQTGSGKTHSMMGNVSSPGIIPRFCDELFNKTQHLATKKKMKVNTEISFFEIYNEKIHDLLTSTKEKGTKKTVLKVREHPVLGPYVEGLSTYAVNSFQDVEGWLTLGNKNRVTAATGMNEQSSRSHSVFTIVLTQTRTEIIAGQSHDHSVNSKINLVDLAGSERQSQAHTSGERLREGANINKSLLTLGKVISLLSDRSAAHKKRKNFIPYRDSVLTWLLKESLGGNSKTAMIATVSPSNQHSEETLSTLRYAHQARSIVNLVRINEDDPRTKIIRDLQAEIERLHGEGSGSSSTGEVARLRSELEQLTRSWQERMNQVEARKAEEFCSLQAQADAKHQEAQDLIQSLKEQNLLLEQEIIAYKRRAKQESVANRKVFDDNGKFTSKMFELLQLETKKATEKLELLRQKYFTASSSAKTSHCSMKEIATTKYNLRGSIQQQ